jgi:osomolarity two-component system sensor histidine kinase TcsA
MFWFTSRHTKWEHPDEVLLEDVKLSDLVSIKFDDEFKRKRILLAEDNLINQKVMLKLLSNLGLSHIDIAVDGAQALWKMLYSRNANKWASIGRCEYYYREISL